MSWDVADFSSFVLLVFVMLMFKKTLSVPSFDDLDLPPFIYQQLKTKARRSNSSRPVTKFVHVAGETRFRVGITPILFHPRVQGP
jgi:hypothetical protein